MPDASYQVGVTKISVAIISEISDETYSLIS